MAFWRRNNRVEAEPSTENSGSPFSREKRFSMANPTAGAPRAEAVKLAALYVHDALNGRLESGAAKVSAMSRVAQLCFAVQTSNWYLALLAGFGGCQMFLALVEPASTFGAFRAEWADFTTCGVVHRGGVADFRCLGATVALEAVAVALYAADIAMKARYMSWRKFVKKRWQQIYLALVCLYALDLLLLAAGQPRPFRCLRGGALLLRSRTLRRVASAVIAVWDVLWRTTLAILILLLGFSSMFVHLFSPDYAQRSDTTAEALMDEPFAGAFDNPFIGMSTLFALLTTENYPQVVYPACPPGSPYCAQLVAFVPVWYLASFVFLAIQTAVIVDKYFLVFKAQVTGLPLPLPQPPHLHLHLTSSTSSARRCSKNDRRSGRG